MEVIHTVLCDIDGVISCHSTIDLLRQYNQTLRLEIPEEQLVGLSREAFHELEQVKAYRAKVGEEKYRWQVEAIQWQSSYVLQCGVIEDALAGVLRLADIADDIGYCTARVIPFDEKWNKMLSASTKLWLKQQRFPNFEQVLFCDGIPAKLTTIANELRTARDEQEEAHVWLIDDCIDPLLKGFSELSSDDQELLEKHLTLIGFGDDEIRIHDRLHVIPLPDWQDVQRLEKEFNYAVAQRE